LILLINQVASWSRNARGGDPQALGHPLGNFPFTDKRIRSNGERRLLASAQMADKDDDQRSRAALSQFFKKCAMPLRAKSQSTNKINLRGS
jgi:hypothetical protein